MIENLTKKYDFVEKKNLVRLGSVYGGWTFENKKNLYGSTILSCGLGEDASFDIEFANMYNAKIIIVDPIPKRKWTQMIEEWMKYPMQPLIWRKKMIHSLMMKYEASLLSAEK